MNDLQQLKLELEDAQDAQGGDIGFEEIEGEELDLSVVSGEVNGVNVDADGDESELEIIDSDNEGERPNLGYGKTHKAIATLVKQQAAQTGSKVGCRHDWSVPSQSQLQDTVSRSNKRAKPVSPRASLVEAPATKRKRMTMTVELPTPQSSRISQLGLGLPSSSQLTSKATGNDKPGESISLQGDLGVQEAITIDLTADEITEVLQESRSASATAEGEAVGWTSPEPLKPEDNVATMVAALTEAQEVIQISDTSEEDARIHKAPTSEHDERIHISDTSEDDEAWTSPLGLRSQESTTPLSHCIEGWAVTCDWVTEAETNPIWDLMNQSLMGEHVMDHTLAYLVYHAKLMERSSQRQVCLVPASLFGAMKQIEHTTGTSIPASSANSTPEQLLQLLVQRNMVWTGQEPPTRIFLPVIDHQHVHCYLWYGDIKQKPGRKKFHCELNYLDSLSRPSENLLAVRFSLAKAMIRALVPQIDGDLTYRYQSIPGYRQAPGTVDCGYYVCQAVSALAFHRDDALHTLRPVASVRANMKKILENCADKALLKLSRGLVAKEPILLHVPRRITPPPWMTSKTPTRTILPTQKMIPRWTTPEYTRSLSEPCDTPQRVRENRSTPPSWESVFGPMPPPNFQQADPESAAQYLKRLNDTSHEMPAGVLEGVSGSAPLHFLESLFLKSGKTHNVRWLPGISIVHGGDEEELERPEDCLSLRRTCQGLSYLRQGQERSLAILTGVNAGHTIRMDWTKESIDYEADWLSASLDIDSLSLIAKDPQFTMPAVLHAYPPRASTLTTKNGLFVDVDGKKTPLSHIPNFTLLTMGQNNQFRVNVFFPHYEKGQDKSKRYITIMNEDDLKTWYEQVFLQALQQLSWNCPRALQDTLTRLTTELPKTYASAAAHCINSTQSFTGYKVMPQILNLILAYAREIVSNTLSLARFRNFFYHICGMNLKAVCEAIPERSQGNPMLHVLQQYPIVDWSTQNYCDIAVDVGLEINVCREKLPPDLDDITLVWKLDVLRELVASSWRKPHMDAYLHSHVVGGLSAWPLAHIALWFYCMHFYMKDKTLTYVHRDNSIGTGFSPEHGILGSAQYETQTKRLQEVWADGVGSYGGRVEWRVGLRTANEMLQRPANLWLERFVSAEAIVALRTRDVVRMKSLMLDSYKWFFTRIQRLPPADRKSHPVALLACVLTYLIHGLVRAPGEMSSHRSMVKDLEIISRARRFGIASIPLERLGPDLLRMSGPVTVRRYPILQYIARKNPAGVRMKHSTLEDDWTEEPESGPDTSSVGCAWSEGDQKWAEQLVNKKLADWLWNCLPVQDRLQNVVQSARKGPFRVNKWRRVAGEGVQYGYRTKGKFSAVQQELFPPDWVLREKGKCWVPLQDGILDHILERINGKEPDHRVSYSAQVRKAIFALLRQWEFLPSAQKDRIWAYIGTGRTRKYMLYKNEQFNGS